MIKTNNFISDEAKKDAETKAIGVLMNLFTDKMVEKLRKNLEKGKSGWDDPSISDVLKTQLSDNINDADWVDVAVISMFLWNLNQRDN